MVVLYLFLAAFAASPELHLAFHPDADQCGHHCVLCLLAQGQIDLPSSGSFVSPPEVICVFAPQIELFLLSTADELLPPGRAPPAVSS